MKELKGDLLRLKKGYICHQVNVDGKMGAGLAAQIKKKWPLVFNEYKKLCNRVNRDDLLGNVQIVKINNELSVVNLFGQYLYTHDRPTRYDAVADAFSKLRDRLLSRDLNLLYIPKLMGCDLGGGVWKIYLAIVTSYFPAVNIVEYEPVRDIYDPKDLQSNKEYIYTARICTNHSNTLNCLLCKKPIIQMEEYVRVTTTQAIKKMCLSCAKKLPSNDKINKVIFDSFIERIKK